MQSALVSLLACPKCRGDLRLEDVSTTDHAGDVLDGTLCCTGGCSAKYPVVAGIPRFVPAENYAASFGYQWNEFRVEQIDPASGISQSERRFWSETAWDPAGLRGKWILDAGCGAGRFLEVVSRDKDVNVVGVDISNAVDAARKTLGGRRNLHLVQASIYDLPFRKGVFDGIYCIGVIQHTPDPLQSVRSLPKFLKTGGKLALTIYEKRKYTLLNAKYLIRPLTRRIGPKSLLGGLKMTMPVLWPITEVLFRLPVIGKAFRFVIPVANYVDDPELSWRQRYQWALMDTFDMLSPAYDQPQTEEDVCQVLLDEGLTNIVRRPEISGLNINAEQGHRPAWHQ